MSLGAGIDTINDGGGGADAVIGASGNDAIIGDTGEDRIYGGKGKDLINSREIRRQALGRRPQG